jgi:hypothetical protein
MSDSPRFVASHTLSEISAFALRREHMNRILFDASRISIKDSFTTRFLKTAQTVRPLRRRRKRQFSSWAVPSAPRPARQAQVPAANTAKNRILTPWTAFWQHWAVIGESENQFTLTAQC